VSLDWWDKHPGGTYFPSLGNILSVHSDGVYYYHLLSIDSRSNIDMSENDGYYYFPPFYNFEELFEKFEDYFYNPF